MNYKKKENKKLITTFLLTIVIILISLIFKQESGLTILQIMSKDIANTIIKVASKPIKIVKESNDKIKEKERIYKKYKKLDTNEEIIKLVMAENEQLKKEISELKEIKEDIDEYEDYKMIEAKVIKRNIGYWDNIITIDKGSKSGIEENLAVITNKGLIGTTTNVSNYYSDVKLITNPEINPKISVQVKSDDKYFPGILNRYDKNENVLIIDGISEYDNIEVSSLVYTTSYNSNIPSGVLLGVVSKITKDEYDLSKRLHVKSDVDFNNISYVNVLIRNN